MEGSCSIVRDGRLVEERTSGDTIPCKVTPVILHGVVSPEYPVSCEFGTYDRLRVGWLNRVSFITSTGRGAARAGDAQGTPTRSHISPSILVYEDNSEDQNLVLAFR